MSLLLLSLVTAPASAQTAPSVPPVDAPELARLGQHQVGTRVTSVTLSPAPTLSMSGVISGKLEVRPRTLAVRLWYPANAAPGEPAVRYSHPLITRNGKIADLVTPGIAIAEAAPLSGRRYPLVLLSHGYGGWSESMSYLGENLASKGYVVAAIDHADAPYTDAASFALSFGNVVRDRARDQREVIASLPTGRDPIAGLIDPARIGLIGYSMGGFGALATAGATYDPASPTITQIPAAGRDVLTSAVPAAAAAVKAVVTIAPWGGQPANRAWTPASLAKIRQPLLMIVGDSDDIVNFPQGAKWIFDNLAGSDRRLLLFQAARHNLGNNAAPAGLPSFQAVDALAEPVWRGDRTNAINLHFVTAFLDLTLKGDRSRASYLDVPTPRAADGEWPVPAGAQIGGTFASGAQPQHWRGFQRRWALGLELTHVPAAAAQTATPAGGSNAPPTR
jgi:predicted dienelactone hydrolase